MLNLFDGKPSLRSSIYRATRRKFGCGARSTLDQDGFAEGPSGTYLSIAAALPENSLGVPLVLGVAGPAERMRGKVAHLSAWLKSAIAQFGAHARSGASDG